MLNVYKFFIKMWQFVLNILFVFQIALMIVVFLTACYWFTDLINLSTFDFAAPVANVISDLIRIFYHDDIEVGGVYVDGSLLLFDLLAVIFVLLITKLKFYINRAIKSLEFDMQKCMSKLEDKFNKQLEKEAEEQIKKYNKVAIMVKFNAKNMYIDATWGGNEEEGVSEKIEEALKTLVSSMKNLANCNLERIEDKILITFSDFSRVDSILNFVEMSINRIKVNMKKKKWILTSFVAVEAYGKTSDFDTKVLPTLEKLLKLYNKNEMLCLGNFNLRYKLNNERVYSTVLRGAYTIVDRCDVYALRKIN